MTTTHRSLALICVLTATAVSPAFSLDLVAGRASSPPVIDGRIDSGEWPIATNRIDFDSGFVVAVNDRMRLYLLVDLLDDDEEDPRARLSEGDWVEIIVDVDENGSITPDVDLIYTLQPNRYDLRIQRYAQPNGLRRTVDPNPIYSSLAPGFGCFPADGTHELREPPAASNCYNHRVWEVAIDLEEIGANPVNFLPTEYVHVGIVVHSEDPDLHEQFPEGFQSDFNEMLEIELVAVPAVVVDPDALIRFDREVTDENGDGIVNDPLEITQAIQHRDNSLRLVARKQTAVRVYVELQEEGSAQPVTVSLYGIRDGRDLPGSPLSVEFWARPDFVFPSRIFVDPFSAVLRYGIRKGRDNLFHTANFSLPDEWVEPDGVRFYAKARFLDQEIESRSVDLFFRPRRIPHYVVIPINEGTESAPVQVDESALAAAESYMKTIYPVPDINFERQEFWAFHVAPEMVTGEILRSRILEDLLWFYDLLAALGAEPLPEQIFGYTVTSELGQAVTTDSLRDSPACGHVAGGSSYLESTSGEFLYDPTVMAHEIDHNIGDRESWGLHVPGGSVGAGTVDPEWERLYEESEGDAEDPYDPWFIREFGFDTRRPWGNGYDLLPLDYSERRFTVIPPFWPELMSYKSAWMLDQDVVMNFQWVHPKKWTSAYRWERMFDAFQPDPSPFPGPTQMAYYVSGRVHPQGLAELDPVMQLPGRPSPPAQSQGEYAVELFYEGGSRKLRIPFTPTFLDSEGLPLEYFHFRLNLPAKPNPKRVLVRRGNEVLDKIRVSRHRPVVRVTAPRGKQEWNGRHLLKWKARDRDNDSLSYAILYNRYGKTLPYQPGRKGWIPVAWGVQGEEYEVDMAKLPGGPRGRFKIVATDGFNTTIAISRSELIVEDKPPTVALMRPDLSPVADVPDEDGNQNRAQDEMQTLPGPRFTPGPLAFEAHGTDLEDGSLPDDAFLWFLGQEKRGLGQGKTITAYFDEGSYLITLIAADSAGNTVEEQFTITIYEPSNDANSSSDLAAP